jgi:hypothetical protein
MNEVEDIIFETMHANGGQKNTEALRAKWSITQARIRMHHEANFPEDAD